MGKRGNSLCHPVKMRLDIQRLHYGTETPALCHRKGVLRKWYTIQVEYPKLEKINEKIGPGFETLEK